MAISIQASVDRFKPIATQNSPGKPVPGWQEVYSQMKGIKKGYSVLNYLMVALTKSTSSQERQNLIASQQKILKQHIAPFAVSDFFSKINGLKTEYSEVVRAKTKEERVRSVKKSAVSSLGLSSNIGQLAQFLHQANFADITKYSKQLLFLGKCSTLTSLYLACVSAYDTYKKLRNVEPEIPQIVPAAMYKKTPWPKTDMAIDALNLTSSVISALNIFCAISFPAYFTLSLGVTAFSTSLTADAVKRFQQIQCEKRLSTAL